VTYGPPQAVSRRFRDSNTMTRPDYHGRSIVNLMSSIAAARGGDRLRYAPLDGLDGERLAAARNVVLWVIDGLGYHWLGRQGESLLQRHLVMPIASVFPPTTASAVTSFLTGDAPQGHGLTGWFMHFKELGGVAAILPFRMRVGGIDIQQAGIGARELLGHLPIADRLGVECHAVSPGWIAYSPFNRAHAGRSMIRPFDTLRQLVDQTVAAVLSSQAPKYVYAYWPGYDSLAHEHGTASREVAAHFQELDTAFGDLLKRLGGSDTILLVTADHGFVDTTPERTVHLEAHPALARCLALPLCGEPRSAYCYLHPHKEDMYLRYVEEQLGHACQAVPSIRLIEEGWFGLGEPHPSLWERVGDYTLLMRENWVIKDRIAGEKPFHHIGVHGGASEAEMTVPLVLAQV
jgi:hypothetical protein